MSSHIWIGELVSLILVLVLALPAAAAAAAAAAIAIEVIPLAIVLEPELIGLILTCNAAALTARLIWSIGKLDMFLRVKASH